MAEVEVIRAAGLAGVPHGFLGRRGGVSQGAVAGLNVGLGSADDPAAVSENRRRAASAVLDGARLVTCYQVHSARCLVAREWDDAARPEADALVTDRPGLLLGVLTADCAPVLLADIAAGVVGAAHAGWKGALGGVTDATVVEMERLGADRANRPENERFFQDRRPGHWQFDLEGYVAARLAGAGVGRVECLGLDTYADPQRFYSFRRATHRGEADYGREIALIGLAKTG